MKRILKKDSLDFQKKAESMIKEFGATKIKSQTSLVTYEAYTNFGLITLKVDNDNISCYSIYTCFDDLDMYNAYTGENSYSGKYNFHITSKELILNQLKMFLDDLKLIEVVN